MPPCVLRQEVLNPSCKSVPHQKLPILAQERWDQVWHFDHTHRRPNAKSGHIGDQRNSTHVHNDSLYCQSL